MVSRYCSERGEKSTDEKEKSEQITKNKTQQHMGDNANIVNIEKGYIIIKLKNCRANIYYCYIAVLQRKMTTKQNKTKRKRLKTLSQRPPVANTKVIVNSILFVWPKRSTSSVTVPEWPTRQSLPGHRSQDTVE